METGIPPFHMGMFLSPFPYGDHHMETGNRFIQLPIWKQGSPYGNGDFQGMCKSPFPYGDRRMETGSRFIQLPIWKWGFPYGRAMEQIMGMRSALRVPQSRESGKITISCPKFGGRYSSMRDLEVAKICCPHFHMGSPRTEMGRESRIFPYGESPFPNRVCFHLGTNTYASD